MGSFFLFEISKCHVFLHISAVTLFGIRPINIFSSAFNTHIVVIDLNGE